MGVPGGNLSKAISISVTLNCHFHFPNKKKGREKASVLNHLIQNRRSNKVSRGCGVGCGRLITDRGPLFISIASKVRPIDLRIAATGGRALTRIIFNKKEVHQI